MKRDSLIATLEELAKVHNIDIRKGKYDGKSGMGKHKGNYVLLIDRSLAPEERVELLTDALLEAGVSATELPPEVRTLFNSPK